LAIDISSLRKILELEQKKNYANTTVIGGLDKFLKGWVNGVAGTITNRPLLNKLKKLNLSNSDYAAMSTTQRQEWIKTILDFTKDLETFSTSPIKATVHSLTPKASKPPAKIKNPVSIDSRSLDLPATVIKGMGPAMAGKFGKLGIKTVRDVLYYFPNRHLDYSQIKTVSQLTEGEQTIIANVWEANVTWLGSRRSTEAVLGDATGNVRAVWFNNPYVAKNLITNNRIVMSGRVKLFNGRFVFESPEWEKVEEGDFTHAGRFVPVYPLTEGLYQRQVRRLIKGAVDHWALQVRDFLPESIRQNCQLMELPDAIAQAHYPDNATWKDKSRIRLVFDELFLLQLGVLNRKRAWLESQPGNAIPTHKELLGKFLEGLPFQLTAAQHKVLTEISKDMEKPQAMSRLLQGDVGSGKTVVALMAMLTTVFNGYQAALMAPTEILAGQHFSTIQNLLTRMGELTSQQPYLYTYNGVLERPLTIALLMGAIPLKKKRELHSRIISGEIDIIIGTHALIQQDVEFKKLGFAVVDEQHRFGVEQRSILRQKGSNPHVLVMTATPIPRTLALTLYGDLDLSVIDELPPGRQLIKTKWLKPNQRASAYNFIRKEIIAGHQAFIICPLIEESESIQARAAVAEYEHLANDIFHDLRLGLLHGKMSSADKEQAMQDFKAKKTDILVSTPVVEVGIDVPNATVMMVESADRFGLSQLHQFRGRVGRGEAQSYCMLLSENPSFVGQERLSIIETVHNGFRLAEEDLKMRGPGEFFGTRQSGLPDLKMAKLSDVSILEMARQQAEALYQSDPRLKLPENALLVKELARVWTSEVGEWS